MTRSSVLQFILLGIIWGASYTFIKVALEGLTPAQLVLTRIVLGLVVLLAFLGLRGIRLPRVGAVWGHVTVAGALGMVVPFLLLAFGEQRTSAAMAGVLIAVLPLATLAVVTAVLPTEPATPRKAVGFVIGFAGVLLIFAPWQGADTSTFVGQLAVVGAACSYAAQTVYIRKFLVPYGLPSVALVAAQLVMATILQAVVTPLMTWATPTVTWRVGLSIVILGVLGTGVAYALYFRLIADLGASTASSVNYLVPVVGVVVSTTLLGDTVTWNMIVGVLSVLVGLAVAENRVAALRARQPAGTPASPPPPVAPAEPDPAEVPACQARESKADG